MKKKQIIPVILTMALLCVGCGAPNTPQEGQNVPNINNGTDSSSTQNITLSTNAGDYFTDKDLNGSYDSNSATKIQLNDTSATCSSEAVRIEGSTITITTEGTYLLNGSLENGMIIVDADKADKIQLVLDSVTISNASCAPIYIKQADKVFLTLAPASANELSNGGTFTAIDDNNIDAVVFSKDDLTLNGSGSLKIISPAGHGIVSKDELTVTGGSYELNTASHGLSGKDNLCVTNATFSIVSGKDGLHAENSDDATLGFMYIDSGSFQITSEGDGISSSGEMLIQNGTFEIIAGGGSVNATQTSSDFRGIMPSGGHDGNRGGKHSGTGDFGGMGGNPPDVPADYKDKVGNAPGNLGDFGSIGKPDYPAGNDTAERPNMPGGDFSKIPEDNNIAVSDDSGSLKGIKAANNLQINGGSFIIDAADDTIHSNVSLIVNGGTFILKSGDDGFHADAALTIRDGDISISECYEGLEGLSVDVLGGNISLTAGDDGLNAAGGNDQSGMGGPRGGDIFATDENSYINIAGGNLYINALGDGMDSNGYLTMSDGYVIISGPNYGDTAILDYGIEATISGGIFIGTGATQMTTNFSAKSTQGSLLVSVGNQTAGTLVTLSDADGEAFITREADQDFSGILFSSPELKQGEAYILTIDSDSIEFTMNKLVYNARTK